MKRIKFYRLILILCMSISSQFIWGQTKDFQAVKLDNGPKIDGVLDDESWQNASEITGFIQYEPDPGLQSTQTSTVKIFYTDEGIYIGAMLKDNDAAQILKEYTKRDVIGNVDWFQVIFDSYQSGINAFAFGVTAVGQQLDMRIDGEEEDSNWDAVWHSAARIVDDGWIAEMFIPFAALRFPEADHQDWNIQFVREIRRHREKVYWNPVNPDIGGVINQSGKMLDIQDIKSPVRLSFNPFVAGYVDNSNADRQYKASYNAGLDLKYGLSDAFTLDMSLIPDFGQVRSDDRVLNLTPFEVYFDENRPFFTEGLEFFDKGNLFYSRRVGSTPYDRQNAYRELGTNEMITNLPSGTQLLNATKVSGRTKGGTGLGLFNAVAGRSYANLRDTINGGERSVLVSPLTNYNVIVVDQLLRNNSSIGLINTNTWRSGQYGDANVTGLFYNINTASQIYGIKGNGVYSHVTDNSETGGHSFLLEGGKIGGKYRLSGYYLEESDTYDINDLGFLYSNNERSMGFVGSYVENNPKSENINKYIIDLETNIGRLYNPNEWTSTQLTLKGFILYRSRVGSRYEIVYTPNGERDYFEPRTSDFSRYYRRPSSLSGLAYISTDYRKPFAIDASVKYAKFNQQDRNDLLFTLAPRYRLSNKLTIQCASKLRFLNNDEGYLYRSQSIDYPATVSDGDILMGRRDRQILENALTLTYIFNANNAFEFRTRHYWDKVDYVSLNVLEDRGGLKSIATVESDDQYSRAYNRSSNFFNIDMNYTWRFAPGSDIILNWKNSIFHEREDNETSYPSVLSDLLKQEQYNSYSVKVIYYLDYNKVI